jgi:zinc protease
MCETHRDTDFYSWRRVLTACAVTLALFADSSASATPESERNAPAAALNPPTVGQDAALPANVERLETLEGITRYRLKSNGMTLLLAPNHAAPVFTFLVVYHVGSRNEAPGNTGSAHLLEHLLFNKSTEHFGRANGHRTFQEVLFEAGADFTSTNMTTWYDRMTGYSTLPADKLELAMRVEADRLGRGLILDSERQPEMSVVRNEYEIGENDPSNALNKAVLAAAIVAHPYHWDTIGYRSDIEGVSTDTLRRHYRNFFWPDNAEAILVGDVDTHAALALFDREFGAFPRSDRPIPQVITVEPPQEGERRVTVKRPGQLGIVQIAWIRPGALHPDFVPLDVLSGILGDGINSRLYQALLETGLASEVSSQNYTLRDPYPLIAEALVSPTATHEQVEAAMKRAVYDVAREGVTAAELERAKRQIEVAVVRGRDGTYNLAASLGEAVASADWKWFVGYVDAIRAVTADDVRRVAATWLVPDHATVGWFVPGVAAEPAAGPAGARPEAGAAVKGTAAPAVQSAAVAGAAGAASATQEAAVEPAVGGPAARAPQKARFASRTLHRVLPNGIIVDVVPNPQVPTVALQGVVLAGDMTAPGAMPALPDLTAMMLQRGTDSRSKLEIAAELDGAGARLELQSGLQGTTITGSALARDLPLLLGVLADELRRPAFPGDELAKAKLELRSDVLRAAESTSRRAIERLNQLVFPAGHPYHPPGTEQMLESIVALTRDDLVAFHASRYVGSSLILAISGDVDADQTAALVEELFGGMPEGTRPVFDQPRLSPGPPAREVVTMPGKANMNFVYGHASGLRRSDPDYEAALLANAALGQTSLSSRIGRRVRDTEGLSYSLYSRFLSSDVLDGVWLVNVAVAPQNLSRALRSTREEIERYAREGITPEELEVQKGFFAGNYQVRLGSNAGIAAALVEAEKFGYGPGYLDEFPARIRAVTREQVDRAIRTRLHPQALKLVVAGDADRVPD